MTAERRVSGIAPPVYPVPPPRGMIVRPRSMHACTIGATSSSVSGIDDDERIFDAPVGRVGHVRDARESVELHVVVARDAREARDDFAAQLPRFGELVFEGVDRRAAPPRGASSRGHRCDCAGARLDRLEPVAHVGDQREPPLRDR